MVGFDAGGGDYGKLANGVLASVLVYLFAGEGS
jgi:hypothetical protein